MLMVQRKLVVYSLVFVTEWIRNWEFPIYHISQLIRRIVIFSLEILEKNNDECILILVIYWKKTGLLHTKISNHNIIYSS